MAAEHIRHWRVGDVDIARIVEVYGFEDDISMLLPDATPQYVQQFGWLLPHFATPDGKMIISFQCFVLRSRGRTAMIDTCIGNDRQREFEVFCNMQNTFLEDLAHCRLPAPSRSPMCCARTCTSITWAGTRGWSRANGCRPSRRRDTSSGGANGEHWKHLRDTDGYHHMDHLSDSIDPIVAAGLVEFIDADFRLTDEVSLIATPGHTPGHVSVLIESRGERAVITGDLMHNPIQIAVPATEARFDMDKPQAARTRRDFVERFCNTGTLVIGSHFAEPTAGRIVPDGEAWKLEL